MAFHIDSQRPAPNVCALTWTGVLDFRAEAAVIDALTQAATARARTLVLDLSGLEAVDGSGLTVLFKVGFWGRRARWRVAVHGLPAGCRTLLQELGFERYLAFYPSRERALGSPDHAPPRDPSRPEPRCASGEWLERAGRVRVAGAPARFAPHLVDRLELQTPASGFGQLWHKVYELRLPGVESTPAEIAALFRGELGTLWPDGAELHLDPQGVAPGTTGIIRMRLPGGSPLVTGFRVLHSGRQSFTFATLKGHMEAGWITFCAYADGDTPVARVESFARTGDPLHELGFWLVGHGEQERFWNETLGNLGRRLGVEAQVQTTVSRLDARRQWAGLGNVPANAAVRTALAAARGAAARLLGTRRDR